MNPLAIIEEILTIGGEIVQDAPQVISIVEEAIAAFKGNDTAALQKAQADAQALANSLPPPDAPKADVNDR